MGCNIFAAHSSKALQVVSQTRQKLMALLHVSEIIPLIFLSCLLVRHVTADLVYVLHYCYPTHNYTQNSTFQTNLNLLLPNFTSKASITGFYNSTSGESIDKVYALFLCRGDVTPQVCQQCVDTATQDLLRRCSNEKGAIIWYEECTVRYSNESFFSIEADFPWAMLCSPINVSNNYQFNQFLASMTDSLSTRAASDSSSPVLATGEAEITEFQKLYCLVQCTPDITGFDCNSCLRVTITAIQYNCNGSEWAMIFRPNCQLRYGTTPFYKINATSEAPDSLFLPPSPPSNRNKNRPWIIPLVVTAPLVTTIFLVSGIWFWFQRRKHKRTPSANQEGEITVESLQLELSTIKGATENFSPANKLGEGGFGVVYKGRLEDGQEIAVKRLSKNSKQGVNEFKTEVLLVAKLQHRNLVKLWGFCLTREEKLLVYEFVPNGSLDQFLFDPKKRAYLDWETRCKIIVGVARGLQYLHEDSRLKVIHRDLKCSNILLDENMNPKISDFGIAKLVGMDQTHISTSRVVGTLGYMSPEYAMAGHFSVKSDVFSFGVILLEIVSGQKNSCFYTSGEIKQFLPYVWRLWKEGTTLDLIDSTLSENFSASEAIRCIHIALLCVQEDAAKRPTTSSVVLMLNSNSVTLPIPEAPAFLSCGVQTSMQEWMWQTVENEDQTNPEQITELQPRS